MVHVLMATDGSTQALAAADFLCDILNPATVQQITVLAVIRPLESSFMGGATYAEAGAISPEAWEEFTHVAEQDAQAAAARTVERLGRFSGNVQTLIRTGNPAEEAVDAAKQIGADMIVVGSRGMGGVRAAFVGSVSERILHMAHCPVLVVRPPGERGK